MLAEQRGISTRLSTATDLEDYRNALTIRAATSSGTNLEVRGTLTGPKQIEKIIGINGYDLEIPLSEHLVIFEYSDRPGVVATLGKILGEHTINIAGMQISQNTKEGRALAVLAVDSALPAGVLGAISTEVEAAVAAEVDLEEK